MTDSKSVPFGGAGSNPANVFSLCSRSSVGRSSASHAEGPGFDPLRELVFAFVIFAEGRAFNPPRELFCLIRYGVVGNMSGSHPVASGSIPGIGLVLLAQLAEHPLNIFCFCLTGAMVARLPTEQEVVGSSPTLGFFFASLV